MGAFNDFNWESCGAFHSWLKAKGKTIRYDGPISPITGRRTRNVGEMLAAKAEYDREMKWGKGNDQ